MFCLKIVFLIKKVVFITENVRNLENYKEGNKIHLNSDFSLLIHVSLQ